MTETERNDFNMLPLTVFVLALALLLLNSGCATKNGSVDFALNIGSRSAAVAGENDNTDGVEVAGSGGVDVQP